MLCNSGTTGKFLPDTSYVCVSFNVDHTMICKREDLSYNASELEDLETELLSMVCKDIEVEQVLQDITGEELIK